MRFGIVAALVLGVVALDGCASRGKGSCDGDGYQDAACRTRRALDRLEFGMSRDEALALMGTASVVPPWHNEYGVGPETIENPFDSFPVTSKIEEEYEVVRFFVGAHGEADCPFIQGRVLLEPLVFFEGKLVGWRWSYLEDVSGERLGAKKRSWRFGIFCNSLVREPTEAADPSAAP